jgi:AraC family transcriptional activator of pobA
MKNIPIRSIRPTQKEPGFSETFNIRNVRDVLAGKDMVQEHHRHDFFFILALKKGSGNHEIDFVPYKIRNHSVFFMRPGQIHQLTLKAGSTGYLVAFKTDFYYRHEKSSMQLLRRSSYKNLCQLDATGFNRVINLLTILFEEHTNKQERYQEAIKANLDILFIELLRHRQHNGSASDDASTYIQERFEDFLQLLESDIANHKQVSHYADKLNLSPYQLNAITRETRGKTCSALIDEHIVLESKRYLLATSNQVTQIAYHLGYEDVSYFIRFFKKHTGHTPEAFRNNFR